MLGLIYLHGSRLILMVNSLVEIYQSHISLDADEPNCLSWKMVGNQQTSINPLKKAG